MIWENGIETCLIPYMKQVASPGSMHDTGCLGLVHWEDPEGWYGEGGGRRVQDGECMYTCIISCMKQVASPGSMHDTGCLGLVHWDDPEGWYVEGGGRKVQDGSLLRAWLLEALLRTLWPCKARQLYSKTKCLGGKSVISTPECNF